MPPQRRRARRDRENTGDPSPAWIGSAVLLGLVVIALIIVLIHAATRPQPPSAAAPPTPTPSGAPPVGATSAPGSTSPPSAVAGSGGGRPAGCVTTGTDQTIPTSPPSGVNWSLNAGFAVPSSAADGPKLHGAAGIGYCYSHTPLGALLAASNLGRGTGTPQETQDAVLNLSVVPNEYSAQVASTPATADDQSGAGIQFAGFRIISYSPDQASITLATKVPGRTDTYPQLTVAMQWYAGDWRAVPQAGPALFVAVASAPSLAGFVPWSGVS